MTPPSGEGERPADVDTAAIAAEPRCRGRRYPWVKWVLIAALLGLLVGEGAYLWPQMHQSWRNLTGIKWGWAVAAILAELVSFSGFARIQKQLLHSGGVDIDQRQSLAVIYAANSMSVTLPAGQVFATAFSYRQLRRWGASPLVTSWQLAMSGVIAAAGLALLGFGGALLAGGSVNPYTLVISIAALIGLVWAGHYAATHPQSVERLLRAGLRRLNSMRGRAEDTGMNKVREVLAQLETVSIGTRNGVLTLIWTLLHRVGDVACLGFACYAVGADPHWAGLMIAFAVGKVVGTIPFMPAGLGYVDLTLVLALTSAAGLPNFLAVSAAFVYRLISLILVAIVGWIVFFFLFRRRHVKDAELDAQIDAELER
jgi:uncharacterized membrane protein YbhN (UPF0104 family)